MTITLELTPKEEADLKRKAALRGQDIKAFLLDIAQDRSKPADDKIDLARLDQLLDQAAKPGPALPSEALTSEGVYQDHP
jgi:uncharacterized protein (DUF1778 family)